MRNPSFRARAFAGGASVILLVAGVTWLGTARSGAAPAPPGLSSVSNQGGPTVALAAAKEPLAKAAAAHGLALANVRSLGTAGPVTFFDVASDADCYATGPGLNGAQLADLFCTSSFPSQSQPVILRLQRVGTSDSDPNPIVTADGLAADGVAKVEFLDGAGNSLESAPVEHNLFWLEAVPENELVSFAALDASGNVVYSTPAR